MGGRRGGCKGRKFTNRLVSPAEGGMEDRGEAGKEEAWREGGETRRASELEGETLIICEWG